MGHVTYSTVERSGLVLTGTGFTYRLWEATGSADIPQLIVGNATSPLVVLVAIWVLQSTLD